MVALVEVVRKYSFRRTKLREEGISLQAGSSNPVRLDCLGLADQLPEIFPIEVVDIGKLPQECFRNERVVRLPEFEHDKPANERLVQGTRGEDTEVIDVAGLATLVAGPDLLGDDLRQSQTGNVDRSEGAGSGNSSVGIEYSVTGEG